MKYCRVYKAYLFFLIMLLSTAFYFTSCKKIDNTYKNYQVTAGKFNGDAYSYLQSQPGIYDSMLFVINKMKLTDTLKKQGITLFAVSNRSFTIALQNINQARAGFSPPLPPVSLNTIDSAVLDTFICRYIVKNKIYSNDLLRSADGYFVTTVRYGYDMQMQYAITNASGYQNGGPKMIIYSYPPPRDSVNHIFTRYWIRTTANPVDIETTNAVVNLLTPGHDFGFGNDFIRAVNKR